MVGYFLDKPRTFPKDGGSGVYGPENGYNVPHPCLLRVKKGKTIPNLHILNYL